MVQQVDDRAMLLGLTAEGGGQDQRSAHLDGRRDIAGGPAAGVGEQPAEVAVGIEEHRLVHLRGEVDDAACPERDTSRAGGLLPRSAGSSEV